VFAAKITTITTARAAVLESAQPLTLSGTLLNAIILLALLQEFTVEACCQLDLQFQFPHQLSLTEAVSSTWPLTILIFFIIPIQTSVLFLTVRW